MRSITEILLKSNSKHQKFMSSSSLSYASSLTMNSSYMVKTCALYTIIIVDITIFSVLDEDFFQKSV